MLQVLAHLTSCCLLVLSAASHTQVSGAYSVPATMVLAVLFFAGIYVPMFAEQIFLHNQRGEANEPLCSIFQPCLWFGRRDENPVDWLHGRQRLHWKQSRHVWTSCKCTYFVALLCAARCAIQKYVCVLPRVCRRWPIQSRIFSVTASTLLQRIKL